MILGVSYMFFVLNALISMICFINLQSFSILLFVAPVVHMLGFLVCLKEPRAIELIVIKLSKAYRCVNRGYHGYTNSYDPF